MSHNVIIPMCSKDKKLFKKKFSSDQSNCLVNNHPHQKKIKGTYQISCKVMSIKLHILFLNTTIILKQNKI